MMDTGTGEPLNLTEEERAALTRLVRRAIDDDRYPLQKRPARHDQRAGQAPVRDVEVRTHA
jgi:hypothetical protein